MAWSKVKTCDVCGGPIEWRTGPSGPYPIHLDGYCHRDREESECGCQLTKCPICQGPVFFIRHNGGSFWCDDLGIPWPKHACFVDRGDDGFLPQVERAATRLPKPVVWGVVVRRRRGDVKGSGSVFIAISCSDKSGKCLNVHEDTAPYRGELVLLSTDSGGQLRISDLGGNHVRILKQNIPPEHLYLSDTFSATGLYEQPFVNARSKRTSLLPFPPIGLPNAAYSLCSKCRNPAKVEHLAKHQEVCVSPPTASEWVLCPY
jgi:hypothetical protein